MRPLLALVLLAVTTAMLQADGERFLPPGTHARTFVSAIDGTIQPYNLYIPPDAENGELLPTVVALHGHGATWESWFLATTVEDWAGEHGYVVVCPHGRGNLFYRGEGATDVFEALSDAIEHAPIDEERLFLVGHSMGGWGTWYLGSTHADRWAGIAPMAGWAPHRLLPNLGHLDPFVIHGDADTAVDVRFSREAVAHLAELGISHRYLELPGIGHESSVISDMLPLLGDWFEGRRREAAPTRIRLRAESVSRGSLWWLAVGELPVPAVGHPPLAAVDAQFDPDSGRIAVAFPNHEPIEVRLDMRAAPFAGTEGDLDARCGDDSRRFTREEWQGRILVYKDRQWEAVAPAELAVPRDPAVSLDDGGAFGLDRIGRALMSATGAEVALLSPTMFLPVEIPEHPAWSFLVDFFPYEDDALYVFDLTEEEVTGELEAAREWTPSWWSPLEIYGEPVAGRSMRVVIPGRAGAGLARRRDPAKVHNGGVRGALYAAFALKSAD